VHKNTVHVCVRIRPTGSNKVRTEFAQFCTFAEDLERLHEFLRKHKVRRVILESTGVYWMPVWNVLERMQWKYDLVLVNPQHVKALPGRKTDQQDSERLAELGQYDLLRASFIPPPPIRELRDLTRRRMILAGDWNRLTNRIRRLLETGNVKLSSVMSSITSKTGQLILQAIASGRSDRGNLAELAQGSLKQKKAELKQALPEHYSAHFRWLLSALLEELSELDARLTSTEARIREVMIPYADPIRRLCTIPGVNEITAWTLIAELGTDMSRFASPAHAASWAGLCPGNHESAGKRQSGRTRKGNRYLRRILVQNAWAVAHIKDECPLTDLFYRIAGRQGMKKATVAVAHRLLVIAFCLLRDGTECKTQSSRRTRTQQRQAGRLIRKLARIGYPVTLAKRADAATPEQCGKCSRWGIPCFHAWNPLRQRPSLQAKQTAEIST
jgi:transposase